MAIDAADPTELAKILQVALLVVSDRVLDAIETARESEERMLADYHADRARAGERKAAPTARKAPKAAGRRTAAALKSVA
jgi:hypothetical protein